MNGLNIHNACCLIKNQTQVDVLINICKNKNIPLAKNDFVYSSESKLYFREDIIDRFFKLSNHKAHKTEISYDNFLQILKQHNP